MPPKILQREQEHEQPADPKESDSHTPHPDEILATDPEIMLWKPTNPEWLITLSLATISMMISLGATVIIPSLPTIVTDLHGTTTLGFWLGPLTSSPTPYLRSSSQPCQIPSGAGLACFTLGTIICSVGKGFPALLAGCYIQGIGGVGIVILGLVITDIVPLRYRPKYYSIIQRAWALAR